MTKHLPTLEGVRANVRTTISNKQISEVRDLKHFHDYIINQMASMFVPAIKEKMKVSSHDLIQNDAVEVNADVIIMSGGEYAELTGMLRDIKEEDKRMNRISTYNSRDIGEWL